MKFKNKHVVGRGSCKCGAIYDFEVNTEPELDEDHYLLKITVITRPNEEEHNISEKIVLKGGKRDQIKENLKSKTPLMTQLDLINEYGGFNKKEVYSLPVLRKAKAEIRKKTLRNPDQIKSLRILNNSVSCKSVIRDLRVYPEYVNIFWTELQSDVAKNTKNCVLSIDATHGLCRSPTSEEVHLYEVKKKEKPLFFYSAVLTDLNITPPRSTPISQMLTQSHTAATISSWMNTFLSATKLQITEATCDCSYPLLNALSKEMNGLSFAEYVAIINQFIESSNTAVPSQIKTILRLDRNHVIRIFCRWKLWKATGKQIRFVCIKILCLTMLETEMKRVERIFEKLLNVMLSPIETSLMNESLDSLLSYIEENKVEDGDLIEIEDYDDNCFEEDDFEDTNQDWITKIAEKVEIKISLGKPSGKVVRPNPYYLPLIMKDLRRVCKLICLYGNVLASKIPTLVLAPTSQYVESEFNILKNNLLLNEPKMMRNDQFLELYVPYANARCLKYIDLGLLQEGMKIIYINVLPNSNYIFINSSSYRGNRN